jgi:hypothetical protein
MTKSSVKPLLNIHKDISMREGGILSRLWMSIVIEKNLLGALDYFVKRYSSETLRLSKITNESRKNKSTIIKMIDSDAMTWNTISDLLFKVLTLKKIDIGLEITALGKDGRYELKDITEENSGTALLELWKIVAKDYSLNEDLDKLIDKQADNDPRVKRLSILKRKTKYNAYRNITSTDEIVSWKVFVNLIFSYLEAGSMIFHCTVYDRNDIPSSHKVEVIK